MFGPCRASRRGLASRAVFLFVALSLVALVSSDADAEEGARSSASTLAAQVDNGAPHRDGAPVASPPAPVDTSEENARRGSVRPAGASAILVLPVEKMLA